MFYCVYGISSSPKHGLCVPHRVAGCRLCIPNASAGRRPCGLLYFFHFLYVLLAPTRPACPPWRALPRLPRPCREPLGDVPGASRGHLPQVTYSFTINTCKSVSKQTTLTPFRMNTYEKQGGGGGSKLTSNEWK